MAKSIIEEALLEAEKLQESLKKNTKEILAVTMRQEIDDIVKESFLSEQEEEEVKEVDVKEIADTYTNENIEGAGIGNRCHEVSFKCDSYYMLNSSWQNMIFD